MKLRRAKREIETGGALAHKEYTVRLDAHLMELLSNLYSDPIWAVVREYWTNGQDGMLYLKRQGGDPAPLEIHVPNDIEPWFEVRDYGVGMDHETVWEVYTQYGNSTKSGSNDDVGGLGIGAKVGFCYEDGGDQWTITSVYEGVTRVYIAAKNDRGMPTLTLLSETETPDAHTGIAVRVPVPASDINAFKAAVARFARRALGEFVIKGDAIGVQGGKYDRLEYTEQNSRFGWRPNGSGEHGVIAVMGGIPYPVDIDRSDFGLSFYEKNLLHKQGSVDLFFNVGDLDIAPNREMLSYTPHTVGRIKARLPEAFQSMTRRFYEELRNQSTIWEALQYSEQNSAHRDIIQRRFKKGGEIRWGGYDLASYDRALRVPLDEIVAAFPEDKRPDPLKFVITRYSRDVYGSGITKSQTLRPKAYYDDAHEKALLDDPKATRNSPSNDTLLVTFDEFRANYPAYYVADCKHAKTVARRFLKERTGYGSLRYLYLIEADVDIDPQVLQDVFQGVGVASLDKHTKQIQEELTKRREYSKEKSLASFRVFYQGSWDETAVDETTEQVYVKLNSNQVDPAEIPDWFRPANPSFPFTTDDRFRELVACMQNLEIIPENFAIIGVPKTRWEELEELDLWESIWEKYKKPIHSYMNRGVPSTPPEASKWQLLAEVREQSFVKLGEILTSYGMMPETGYFAQFYAKAQSFKEEVAAYVKKVEEYTSIVRLRKLIRGSPDGRTLKRVPKLDTQCFSHYNDWLKQKYPLLAAMTSGGNYNTGNILRHWRDKNDDPIGEYIRSMDRVRSDLNKIRPSL